MICKKCFMILKQKTTMLVMVDEYAIKIIAYKCVIKKEMSRRFRTKQIQNMLIYRSMTR